MVVTSADQELLPQPPFLVETQAAEAAAHGVIARRGAAREAAQAQGVERVAARGVDGVGCVAASPAGTIANEHAEIGDSASPVDVADTLCADELARILLVNGEKCVAPALP